MSRLLNKTLWFYSLFSVAVLLCTAPFFYWLSEKLYLDDVDEAIVLRKKEFFQNNMHALTTAEVDAWNRFNRDVHILPDTVKHQKDVIFQKAFYDSLYNEWEPYRVLYSDVKIQGKPHTLMIKLNLVESSDLIQTIGVLYLIILSVLLIGFVIVSRIISRRLWKPFYHALSGIEQFNLDHAEGPQFQKTKTKEFHQLNTALEKLMRQNRKTYLLQKQFTQNAAHELQTPLAIFQSKLDLLLQNPSLTEPQSQILQSLYEASTRLSRTTKNLLLLAKIENNQFAETERFTINQLVMDVLPYFEEQAESKCVKIAFVQDASIPVQANKGLTEILINNLLLNAIRHNISNGFIKVQISGNELHILNTGMPEELDESRLFKRFGKTTEDGYNSGLGLSIVKEICDRYRWKVHYFYRENFHEFSIRF